MSSMHIEPFNRYPKSIPKSYSHIFWLDEFEKKYSNSDLVLAIGNRRSYGDVCLSDKADVLDFSSFNKFISFDKENEIITCQAGVSLEQILKFIVPQGYFLPVTPGTKYITIAGAVANDIHGKNHHSYGTFGCHVTSIKLYNSIHGIINLSPSENSELFNATIGGLGLTGIILEVSLKLIKINSMFIDSQSIKFKNIDEFYKLNEESEKSHKYTVAWVDCTSKGKSLGRGLYNRGNFADDKRLNLEDSKKKVFPLDYPFINNTTVNIFNALYYNQQFVKTKNSKVLFEPFFYPLDGIIDWNKSYGPNGFLQYQFVIPIENSRDAMVKILEKISTSGISSFLTVLKTFGSIKSPGLLSFPRKGITLAIDFRMEGKRTLELLNYLDDIVLPLGGALYPAKDARMSKEAMAISFPNLDLFKQYIDPKINSLMMERLIK